MTGLASFPAALYAASAGPPIHARCRQLLVPGWDILVEIDLPGADGWRGWVALCHPNRTSNPGR